MRRQLAILSASSRAALPATLFLPVFATIQDPVDGGAFAIVASFVIPIVAAVAGYWVSPGGAVGGDAGRVALTIAAALFFWVEYPGGVFVTGGVLGLAVGLMRPGWPRKPGEDLIPVSVLIAIAMTQQWDIHIPAGICAVIGMFAADPAPRRRRSIARMAVVPVLTAAASLAAIGWVGSTSPTATWFGDRTSRGPTTGNRVALTFDDGPNGEATLQLAGILEQNNTRGTFFVTGEGATRQAAVVKELADRGHTIGNHSETHDTWDFLSPWYPELMRAQRSIAAASGVCPNLFRPPGGRHSPFMARIAEDHGLTVVTWDVDVGDLNRDDVRAMAREVVDRARAGSIILLHDGPSARDRSALIEALPRIIDGLKEAGLSPVPLNDLLSIPPSQPPEACKQAG